METIQNPDMNGKWKCLACNTWCSNQAKQCSWCGKARQGVRDVATTTESKSTPDSVKREQEALNKLRNLATRLPVEQKEELIAYIEKTYRI